MKNDALIGIASSQLDRILGFFPRVETKISALFAVDVAMLALLGLNAQANDVGEWYLMVLYIATVIALGASIVFLYRASFPQLKGGHASLVYFREIGTRTEAAYIKEMRATEESQLVDDVLGQVWRNSEILAAKFDGVRHAFIATAVAVPFWFTGLLVASIEHAALVVK